MTEEDMLRRAVLESPDDDTPRLAYADWLMENGREGYGEYIKLCVETDNLSCPNQGKRPITLCSRNVSCPVCDRRGRLNVLYEAAENSILEELRGYGCRFVQKGPFARGMVNRLEMPCADFLRHAEALFRRHPVTEVLLTDKEPARIRKGRVMFFGPSTGDPPNRLPAEIWYDLPHVEYGQKDRLLDDVSKVCVAYGRKLAGLPKRAYTVAF